MMEKLQDTYKFQRGSENVALAKQIKVRLERLASVRQVLIEAQGRSVDALVASRSAKAQRARAHSDLRNAARAERMGGAP